jgi:hypothetical protein
MRTRLGTVLSLALAVALLATLLLPGTVSAAPAAKRNFVAVLVGGEETPPVETRARGVAVFHLSKDGTQIRYKITVANIENVFAAHIHFPAARGDIAPPVVTLYSAAPGGGEISGVLARGTFAATTELLTAMRTGMAYVNVHTNDTVGATNTGPGDMARGEIRGQIR